MWNSLRVRIGVPAAFAAVVISIVLGISEVQEWEMPAPLAVTIIVILLMMVTAAIGDIFYELVRAIQRLLFNRAVTADWVSTEAPGKLDFEPDYRRASDWFSKELVKLSKDTQKIGKALPKHTKSIQNAINSGNPFRKQKKANHAAKDIDRSAVFIIDRGELLESLVNEMHRNGGGLIEMIPVGTQEEIQAGRNLLIILNNNVNATKDTLGSVKTYKNAVRDLEGQNLSRTLRIASKKLGDALDVILRTIRKFNSNTLGLKSALEKKIPG